MKKNLKIPKEQCPKEKVQKDKQRSTNHTHKTKYRVTRTPLCKCSYGDWFYDIAEILLMLVLNTNQSNQLIYLVEKFSITCTIYV
jgi:hypothetical protein